MKVSFKLHLRSLWLDTWDFTTLKGFNLSSRLHILCSVKHLVLLLAIKSFTGLVLLVETILARIQEPMAVVLLDLWAAQLFE